MKEFQQEIKRPGKEDTAYQQAMKDVRRSMQKIQGKEEILQHKDGLLYHKGLLWVPENVRKAILHTEHDR
jgi:hypothetical protein